MDEVLVLLRASAPITSRDLAALLPTAGGAAQLFGERVLIVRLGSTDCVTVAAIEGVSGVYTGAVPADMELPQDLTGRLAVAAWNERRQTADAGGKRRLGDGAAWDDPRFEREGRPADGD